MTAHLMARPRAGPATRVGGELSGQDRRRITRRGPGHRGARKVRRHQGGPQVLVVVAVKQRNTAERAFNRLRQHWAVATKYDKRDFGYRGTVAVAAIASGSVNPVP